MDETKSDPQMVTYEINGVCRAEGMAKNVVYVAAGNGIFRVDKTAFGEIVTTQEKMPDVPDMTAGLTLDVPKIPRKIMDDITSFFQSLHTEAYVQIWFDPVKKEYMAFPPDQEVSGASVDYKMSAEQQAMVRGKIQVAEIHSHVDMDAFFSGIDDRDEQGPLIYGVIGKVHSIPVVNLRAKVGDAKIELKVTDVFDGQSDYPKDWNDRVKEKSFGVIGYGQPRGHYGDADLNDGRWWRFGGKKNNHERKDRTMTEQARVNDSDWERRRLELEMEHD